MAGPDHRVVAVWREDPLLNRRNDRCEVAAVEGGVAWATGEKGVTREQKGRVLQREADGTRRVSGGMESAKSQFADLVHGVVLEQMVVTR